MITGSKKIYKILIPIIIIIFAFLFFQKAQASIMSDFSNGITTAVRFVTKDLWLSFKNNFCEIYLSQIGNGNWKEGEIRTGIGGKICIGYKPPLKIISLVGNDTSSTSSATSSVKSILPQQNTTKTFTPETITPGALIGEINTDGNSLDNYGIIYWTNIERQNNTTSLISLSENSKLSAIALARVQDMFAKGYFAHISPTGDSASKQALRIGYDYITLGENIALGNFGGNRKLVLEWMASPGHRANILNKNYTEIGVAAIEGIYQGQKVWIAAQIFGRPVSDCKEPDPYIKNQIDSGKNLSNILNIKLQSMQSEIEKMDKSNVSDYNLKVAEYNVTAKEYNDLITKIKALISKYNIEVQTFNSCIKSI